jgi:hypothetical protein
LYFWRPLRILIDVSLLFEVTPMMPPATVAPVLFDPV